MRATGLLFSYICAIDFEHLLMKKLFSHLIIILVLSFSSCDMVSDLIPDVDTDFSKTFQIQIFTPSGTTDPQIVDVTTSEDYNDFKNNIGGYELRKITYRVKNVNAPEDMYFSGTVVCGNEENTEAYIIGTIAQANLAALDSSETENEVILSTDNIDKVLGWLDSPGIFKVNASYALTKADGTPYSIIGVEGSNFELVVKFYVTVKTKV
jgi:hypothetical protein